MNSSPYFFPTERRKGFEPSTPSLGSPEGDRPGGDGASQPGVSPLKEGRAEVQRVRPLAPIPTPFGPQVVHGLRGLEGGAEHLLSVRQVAERLGVSPATIYKLCEQGELPHARVANAIRIAPADLGLFVREAKTRR